MKEAMETAIGEQTAEQFRSIEYLNIIGNLGPLVGLLGTVLGMIQAFSAMQAAKGDANPHNWPAVFPARLTFLGLFLAIPCLAAFGVLRTIVDRLTVRGAMLAERPRYCSKLNQPTPNRRPSITAPRIAATPQPRCAKAALVPNSLPASRHRRPFETNPAERGHNGYGRFVYPDQRDSRRQDRRGAGNGLPSPATERLPTASRP